MKSNELNIHNDSEREITATRILKVPRDLVWKVWTEPEHIKQWWGPDGFTNTIESMEVRAGRQWKFIMHGPDGVDYRNIITYIEVKKPELIIYEHGPSPKFNVKVTFETFGKYTRLNMRMTFDSAEELKRTVKTFNAVEGLEQTLNRLEGYLNVI